MSCYDELARQGAVGENSFSRGEEENIDDDGNTMVDNVVIAVASSADSSGEDDSDEEEAGGNIEVDFNVICYENVSDNGYIRWTNYENNGSFSNFSHCKYTAVNDLGPILYFSPLKSLIFYLNDAIQLFKKNYVAPNS